MLWVRECYYANIAVRLGLDKVRFLHRRGHQELAQVILIVKWIDIYG